MRIRQTAAIAVILALAATGSQGGETSPLGDATALKVAVVSSNSVFCDPDANPEHFESIIKDAAAQGARLVCFPELALMAYSTEKEILDVAEEIPGPSTRKLETITRALGVYVSMGMAEKDGEKHHVAQAVIGLELDWSLVD